MLPITHQDVRETWSHFDESLDTEHPFVAFSRLMEGLEILMEDKKERVPTSRTQWKRYIINPALERAKQVEPKDKFLASEIYKAIADVYLRRVGDRKLAQEYAKRAVECSIAYRGIPEHLELLDKLFCAKYGLDFNQFKTKYEGNIRKRIQEIRIAKGMRTLFE